MHINWFSPLPPARTDIANYTTRLLPALAKRAEIHLWAPQDKWESSDLSGVSVQSALQKRLPWTEINFRGLSVFQMGNDVRFHGPLLDLHARHGGIVVLHDTNLHEMQRMHLVEHPHRPDAYLALLSRSGGEAAVALGRAVLRGEVPVEEAARRYPLTDSVLAGAHGVVVHNPLELSRVAELSNAPCLYLPLPYEPKEALPKIAKRRQTPEDPLHMVMFGFLHGKNRRLESVFEAWRVFPRRDRLRLTLFGEYDRSRIKSRLIEDGLREFVELHGYLDTPAMDEVLANADLALNLRYPSRGEASGSLLRIWSHALPCFVSDAGYYGELPNDLVTKINPQDEISELHRHWNAFLDHPKSYRRQGQAGRRHLEQHHTPEAYVEQFMNFLPEVADYRSEAYLERWLSRLAQEYIAPIPQWAAQHHWQERIARELTSLLPRK